MWLIQKGSNDSSGSLSGAHQSLLYHSNRTKEAHKSVLCVSHACIHVCEAGLGCVDERATEWVSLAAWCILPGLNQCHISPCRSVSQGESWATGWQSLALMDKAANKIFSTNLSPGPEALTPPTAAHIHRYETYSIFLYLLWFLTSSH